MKNAILEGRTIAYLDEVGSGSKNQTILLNHGFASSAKMNWEWTGWIETLVKEGFRVIVPDQRGHGESTKFYQEEDYGHDIMAQDAVDLLELLEIEKAHVMGYSMGSRISAVMAANYPYKVDKLILAGNGYNMIKTAPGSEDIRDALLAPSFEDAKTQLGGMFRQFAELTKSDLKAMAACIMSIWKTIPQSKIEGLKPEVLVIAGSADDLAVTPERLANLIPNGHYIPIPKRNHMNAVGDKVYKAEVLKFLTSEG